MRYRTIWNLALEPGDAVLDVACGTGLSFALLEEAIGPSGRLVGVELSPEMAAHARTRIERAGWRNAELLVSAPTPAARALVAQEIELTAATQAAAIALANSYLPPLLTTGPRDAFCASHNANPPPMPYAFGMPSAY